MDENLRKLAIGGSEIGAVLGCNPRTSAFAVWERKKGGGKPLEPTEEMLVGRDLEEGIARIYARRTGRPVEISNITQRHPDHPFLAYTPDAYCTLEPRGVEFKHISFWQRFQYGPTPRDTPARDQLQCRWYMAGTGLPRWDLAALCGSELLIYTFERDMVVEGAMLELGGDWYSKFLVGDEVPPIEPGTEADNWLRRKFPRHVSDIRWAEEREIEWLDEYAMVRRDQKRLTKRRDELEVKIQQGIGDSEGVEWPHGVFTWRKPKDSQIVSWQKLADSLLEGYPLDQRDGLIKKYTTLRENSRRIHFRSDVEEAEGEAA